MTKKEWIDPLGDLEAKPEGWNEFWFEMLCENEQKFNMPPRQLVEEFRYRW